MHARTPLAVAVGTLCGGLALTSTVPGFAGTATHATTYAFQGSGYGTKVIGGQVPAASDTTAYQNLACTNRSGLQKTNDIVGVKVPGLGTVSGVKSRVWTTDRNGVVASHARHTIAQITIASKGVGSLDLNAIRSEATAFHNASGFHASTVTLIGSITMTPAGGLPPQTFPAPTPNQPTTIPGLATISVGSHRTAQGAHSATASALALRVHVIPSATTVKVAHSRASLGGGLTVGIFSGHSNATRIPQALTKIAHSGPNPLTVMPCIGTEGRLKTKSLASLTLDGKLVVQGLSSSEKGSQGGGTAQGFERAKIAGINLGGGQLVVNAIVGQANVTRTANGWVRTAKGTRLGSITANGQTQTFPPSGVIEIPGVAKLERKVVTKSKTGIAVIALRVTLLDGSGAVINLGEAKLNIKRIAH